MKECGLIKGGHAFGHNKHLAVYSFDIVSVWKLSFTKLTLLDRLRGPLRLISLAQWATKLLFLLAPDHKLLAHEIGLGFSPALKTLSHFLVTFHTFSHVQFN